MSEQNTPPSQDGTPDAIDINDFVYAATGSHVRRLTMPDGTHWFPAVDVCGNLGYANTSDAVRDLVPEVSRKSLANLALSYPLRIPRGHGLKKSMNLIDLQGMIRLVNASTKPEAEPFKQWVTDV